MERNNPLDFMTTLTEEVDNDFMSGESTTGEIELPEAETQDADIDSMEFNFGDEESLETPEEEVSEHAVDPRDLISELKKKISDLKEEISASLKPLFPEDKEKELAEALDDATSALDLCDHHLTDIDNSLSDANEVKDPEEVLTDTGEPSLPVEGLE